LPKCLSASPGIRLAAFLLTLGAGGVLTEILGDTVNLLLPASRSEIMLAFAELRIGRLLEGYRGKPAADMEALADAVIAICRYARNPRRPFGRT
jgi:hypothetical protein